MMGLVSSKSMGRNEKESGPVSPISDEELLDELVAGVFALGRPPTAPEMTEFGEYGVSTYANRFGSWNDAKKELDKRLGELDAEDVPSGVEVSIEIEYDCPDCEYYRTGWTTGPQNFLSHLEEEHGYKESRAKDMMDESPRKIEG